MTLKDFEAGLTGSAEQGIFGIPTTLEASQLVLLPVPWEVTTSYGSGASLGPEAILHASPQIDLFDIELRNSWKSGYHWMPLSDQLKKSNDQLKTKAQKVIQEWEELQNLSDIGKSLLEEVNVGCKKMVETVKEQSLQLLSQGKLVGVVGGDHSTPEGLIAALAESSEGDFGVLHVDAHCDLRKAYQGFQHSHASIMHNIMQLPHSPKKLVQVGIRDFCEEEFNFSQLHPSIKTFWDRLTKQQLQQGQSWDDICEQIISELPKNVYISFDIDGLSPEFCPHTGTPVPGGLSYDQAVHLLSKLGRSGRRIIGFDLNEVAPSHQAGNEWDGNVGARLLFLLCGWCVTTQKQ